MCLLFFASCGYVVLNTCELSSNTGSKFFCCGEHFSNSTPPLGCGCLGDQRERERIRPSTRVVIKRAHGVRNRFSLNIRLCSLSLRLLCSPPGWLWLLCLGVGYGRHVSRYASGANWWSKQVRYSLLGQERRREREREKSN